MEAANVERIFTPFFTTHRGNGGTGVGYSEVACYRSQGGNKVRTLSRGGDVSISAPASINKSQFADQEKFQNFLTFVLL